MFKSFIFEVGFNVRDSEIYVLNVGITLAWNVATRSTKAVIYFTALFIFLAFVKSIPLLCGVGSFSHHRT